MRLQAQTNEGGDMTVNEISNEEMTAVSSAAFNSIPQTPAFKGGDPA
jgi:hypothetical protein